MTGILQSATADPSSDQKLSTSTTVQAMKPGAVEFLTKPLSDEILLSAIRQALEHAVDSDSRTPSAELGVH
jgi:FixJ family two-component response regulator